MSASDAAARDLLRRLFDTAVAAAEPGAAVRRGLPDKPRGRCVVVGAGKAAAAMAAAVDAAWPDVDLRGVVVTSDGNAMPAGRITVLTAAHPVPDARSVAAAEAMLEAVAGLGPDDLVLALISGGGSALMALPVPPLTLAGKQAVNRALLTSGASIGEINTVRKHLSAIKGGKLAAAARPARVVTLAISDIPGDDPAMIASGPTLADSSTAEAAAAILQRHGIALPDGMVLAAAAGANHAGADRSDKARGDACRVVASPALALQAAAALCEAEGWRAVVLGDAIEGEAREVAQVMAGMARSVRAHGWLAPAPLVLLSGGETTVTLPPGCAGRGGRNREFALALALALDDAPGVWALAADTDGVDGSDDGAGALVTPDSSARARALGLDLRALLAAHDSHAAFAALGDTVVTGPTRTNVNDFRAILVAG